MLIKLLKRHTWASRQNITMVTQANGGGAIFVNRYRSVSGGHLDPSYRQ